MNANSITSIFDNNLNNSDDKSYQDFYKIIIDNASDLIFLLDRLLRNVSIQNCKCIII